MRREASRPVFLVGTLPPPVHGMAVINQALQEHLAACGVPVRAFNLVPASNVISRTARFRIRKSFTVLRQLLRFLYGCMAARPRALYMGISGGPGRLFELPFVVAGRLLGLNLWLHHHTFSYLQRRAATAYALVRAAGSGATHVVLCDAMKQRLGDVYGVPPERCTVLSNAAFLGQPAGRPQLPRKRLSVLGFLGNVAMGKGIDTFLDVTDAVARAGLKVEARIAGPCVPPNLEGYLNERVAANPAVTYVGPRYGDEKGAFLRGVDVLLLPSRLPEAEPLVALEALSYGIPVLATGRGCIPEVIEHGGGRVLPDAADFVPAAVAQVIEWVKEPGRYNGASREALDRFTSLHARHAARLDGIVASLTSAGPPQGEVP